MPTNRWRDLHLEIETIDWGKAFFFNIDMKWDWSCFYIDGKDQGQGKSWKKNWRKEILGHTRAHRVYYIVGGTILVYEIKMHLPGQQDSERYRIIPLLNILKLQFSQLKKGDGNNCSTNSVWILWRKIKNKIRKAEEFKLDHAFQRVGLTVVCRHACVCVLEYQSIPE